MNNLRRVVINTSLIFFFLGFSPIYAQRKNIENIRVNLQSALNGQNDQLLNSLISKDKLPELNQNFRNFIPRFPNAKWSVRRLREKKSNKVLFEVLINAERQLEHHKFSLNARQVLNLDSKNGQIINYQIVNESSVLKTIKTPLKIKLDIPDEVLTGSRYEVNIILENPLGEDFLSGGLINVDSNKLIKQPSPYINLFPLGAGGLFKSVQAPFKPGHQTLAALLIHPKGIISITKLIRVVPEK